MTRASILLILLMLFVADIVSVSAKEAPDWTQVITPAGEPLIKVEMARSSRNEPFNRLTLIHRLRFDGVRYLSRLFVAELDSRLVSKGEFGYEWRTLTGQVLLVTATVPEKSRSSEWRIVKDAGPDEIAVVGGNQEVYIYRKSRLVEYEQAGRSYRISEGNGERLVRDSLGNTIVRQVEGDMGLVTITAHGSTVVMRYNERMELLSCGGDTCEAMEFDYNFGLLVSVRRAGTGRRFVWGEMIYPSYENPKRCLPPVVVQCDGYSFKYTASRYIMSGTVYYDNKKFGNWSYSFKSGL